MKENQKKEEIAEDWCFVCKDGGMLLVCDYKKCVKSYHPDCVGKDDSFLENGMHWTCDWHSCFICHRSSKFRCYVCPQAVCRRCISAAEFVHVRKKKGFCNNCLKLALLVEEKKDIDSDGERVDFKDLETVEGLFMEYWEIINKKEGFTIEDLRAADLRLKKELNYNPRADSNRCGKIDKDVQLFPEDDDDDDDDLDNVEELKRQHKRKRSKLQAPSMKRNLKSKEKEFIGWGSKSLIQFLESIGKDPSEKFSQHDVCSIINGYIKEKNLFHPQKKKKVVCDERLKAVLGRKIVNKHTIYDLLDSHFAENLEKSEDDEVGGYSSDDKDTDISETYKRQRNSSTDKVSKKKKKKVFNIPQLCFAAIVMENIKLVYLKRSLVQELAKKHEEFERKVIGSFIKVKSGPQDDIKKSYHQLMQVTGIEKSSSGENATDVLLQVSDAPKDIYISMLSDDDFSEEECDSLRQRIKDGLFKKLTIDELEQKARTLHEDITKHWIARELALLQNRIDRANEKGWRRDLYEYLERRKLLETSAEQSRLLQMAPTVIPDVSDFIPITDDVEEEDEKSPKSILVGSSEIPGDNREGNGTSSGDGTVINKSSSNDGDRNEQAISANTAAKVAEVADEKNQNQTQDVEEGTEKKQEALAVQPIELNSTDDDDDGGNDKANVENGKKSRGSSKARGLRV